MKIAIIGTGSVGDTIGSKLISMGHQVMMGSRTNNNDKALAFVSKNGNKASCGTFSDAAAFADTIVNCSKGEFSQSIFESISHLTDNKIIIDIANPLDFSKGTPPCLIPSLSNTYSLGEAIQASCSKAHVVKTLNTMWCGLMVNPNLIGNGNHVNYLCGNDGNAKSKVKELLIEMGWKNENLLDLGDISNARATEAVLPIWLRVWGATKNGAFNFRIIS